MRDQILAFIGFVAIVAATVSLPPDRLAAQARRPAPRASATARTPTGHPDLEGTYDVAKMTPVERPAGVISLVLPKEEAAAMELYEQQRQVKNDAPLSGDRGRTRLITVDGQKRSSLVIDPPNGRIPPIQPEALKRTQAYLANAASPDASEGAASGPPGAFDGPETRPPAERCPLGFLSTAGPPSADGWATRSATGKATRWRSTRRTSPAGPSSRARAISSV